MPKQALTNGEADALAVRNRKWSPLLRLPAELRNRIFEYAFVVRIVRFNFVSTESRYPADFLAYPPITAGARDISSLLRRTIVCRQIHSETAILPVKLNTFVVDIIELVDMVNAMPKEVQDQIHSLRIDSRRHRVKDTVIQYISNLAKLPSLRKISVLVSPFPNPANQLIVKALRKWAGEDATVEISCVLRD